MATASADDDIDTWRDVHRHLTLAILQSRDNVAAELAKRRYLLEEINRSPAGGPSSTAASGQGSAPAGKKVPKKASSGKLNKNTPASAAKTVKHSMKYPPNMRSGLSAYTTYKPVGVINNSLPAQKK